MLSQFRSAVATTLAGLQEGVNDEDVDMGGAANQAELRDVLRNFQVEQQMLKNLLRDKDKEAQHYKTAAEAMGGEIPPLPPAPSSVAQESSGAGGRDDSGGGDQKSESDDAEMSADAKVDLAVRALRLERRNTELIGKVKGVEAMLEAMSMERSQALEVCNAKEETIEKLVSEYSHLSGEMRESGERDGETIAALEEEKEDLTSKLAVLEGHLRQISESADLVQQITDQSTEEGVKQTHDLSAAKTQVASLTTKLAEAAARADAAEELVAMAKAEAAEARRAAAAASPGKEALQETAEEKSSAAAAEAAATAAAVEAAREEVKGAMGAEREAAIAALREELEVSTRNMSGIGLLNKTSQPNS
jgi:chromosome segregation ATPase